MSDDKKHFELHEEIKANQEVVDRLRELLREITGEEEPTAEELKDGSVSLQSVLNYGPKRLREKRVEALSLIDRIHSALFVKEALKTTS